MKKIIKFLNTRIEIGKVCITYWGILFIILLLILFLGLLISPKTYYVSTGKYNRGSKKDNENVLKALGPDNTEERFKIYFDWYNVIHELGHGMIKYNGNVSISSAKEEQLVNDFAVAYWRRFGEEEKLELVGDIVYYATSNIEGLDKNENYMEYAEKHWDEPSFKSFNGYGWFQFNSTKKSLEGNKSLEDVLKEMGVKNFKIVDGNKLEYKEINEEVSTKILDDAVKKFNSWGLKYPKVTHVFSDNPNNNFSGPYVKLYNIVLFPDIITNIKYIIKK